MSHLGVSYYMDNLSELIVLILVVMDVALGLIELVGSSISSLVLILVVMDVALGLSIFYFFKLLQVVLILVVMDVALGQVFSQTLRNQ